MEAGNIKNEHTKRTHRLIYSQFHLVQFHLDMNSFQIRYISCCFDNPGQSRTPWFL